MIDTVTTQYNTVKNTVRDSAYRVWLAGLGTVATAQEETNEVFERMVQRGQKIETQGKRQLERGKRQVEKATAEVEAKVETQVERVETKLDRGVTEVLNRVGIPSRQEIGILTSRVEELTRQIAVMAGGQTPAATAATAAVTADADRKVYYVATHDEGWKVEAAGATRATSVHPTKDEAVTAAKELARNQEPSQVVIFKADGVVQTTVNYGD